MEQIYTLSHILARRQGSINSVTRDFSEFLINGQSLKNMLNQLSDVGMTDCCSCLLSGGAPSYLNTKKEQLLLRRKPDTDTGRVMIYVCPECADLGCGAYTVVIVKKDVFYIWQGFAYENGYEEPVPIKTLGPFYFESLGYIKAIENACCLAEFK